MIATNRAVRQARPQVFQSGHAIATPFYNRTDSKNELKHLFDNREELTGTAIVIASPFGTGKTFFIETVGPDLDIAHRDRAIRVPDVSASSLKRARGSVLFLDEADTKAPWPRLDDALARIGEDLAASGRTALLLGDYALRNSALLDRLPSYRYLTTFEPLDQDFLRGVIIDRLRYYIGEKVHAVDDIIEPALYEILVPASMSRVNSLRTVLAFLEQVAEKLPYDNAPCYITVEMARAGAIDDINRLMDGFAGLSTMQERFLTEFVECIGAHHVDGGGLEDGFNAEMMMAVGEAAGYRSWEELVDDVIEPFAKNDLLLSRGTPRLDENGKFVRFVEPFYPSLQLMLLG